jgi:hypothetical protein
VSKCGRKGSLERVSSTPVDVVRDQNVGLLTRLDESDELD